MRARAVLGAGLAAVALASAASPAGVAAQGYRGWSLTQLRGVSVRPLRRVTVDRAEVVVAPDGGTADAAGRAVVCGPADCSRYEPAEVEHAFLGTQDLAATVWGLGFEGLSVTALARARADFAGDLTWPRSDDPFDLLIGYAQLDRGGWRVRAGRQETLAGFGFSGFDGGSVRWAGEGAGVGWGIEGYGGLSLARALSEPANEALRGLEDFLPDRSAWLVGAFGQLRVADGATVGARYQREILSDRSALVSERGALDVHTLGFGPVGAEASADYDFGFGRFGSAHLRLDWAATAALNIEASARRSVPYFELSTIWGFFSPVAYHEVGLRGSWAPSPGSTMWARGAWRRYEDADATVVLRPLRDRGWQAAAGGRVRLLPALDVEGRYALDWGAGSFLSSADVALRWSIHRAIDLSATATTFQQIEEYRLQDGRAYGGGLSFEARLRDEAVLEGGGSLLLRSDEGSREDDWRQLRVWTALRVALGDDPGARRARRRIESTERVGAGTP